MFEPKIDVRLNTPDNIEIVRDQICGLLAIELNNQYEKALEENDPTAEDYNIKVYLENTEPWSIQSEDDSSAFPLVNVSLQETSIQSGSTGTDKRVMRASFNLDCYHSGSFDGDGSGGRLAVVKCWKVARVVRNIIDAANYTYLGLREVVKSRQIQSIETGLPNLSEASFNVCICRIRLTVDYYENSPQVTGPIIEPMNLSITDNNGVIVVDMNKNGGK